MAAFQIVFRTSGFAKAYLSTVDAVPFVLTSGNKTAFFTTAGAFPIVLTSGKKVSFFQTTSLWPIVKTTGAAIAFVVTPDSNNPKDLKLKIGTLEITGNYTIINVPDSTGDYDASLNPGGYNILPLPYNQYRPYRDNVSLWTVYRIWDVYGSATQTPSSQAQQYDEPYLYPLSIPTTTNAVGEETTIKGIYELILIAAPRFNPNNSGGTYLDQSVAEEVAYIVNGTDTTFSVLSEDDYLYYVNEAGQLTYMDQVLKIFSETELALTATAANIPTLGSSPKMYGNAAAIGTVLYATGAVSGIDSGLYYPVSGSGTTFLSSFSNDEYVYGVDPGTGDYILFGQVFESETETLFNLYNKTESTPSVGDKLLSSPAQIDVINSQGAFDYADVLIIYGDANSKFTAFTSGQSLYYQDAATGTLEFIGDIDNIISDTELTISSAPVGSPVSGDRLFASDSGVINLISSGGTLDGVGAEETFYTLMGSGTDFTNFSPDDYVYLISQEGEYNLLGQIARAPGDEAINFYSIQDVTVTPGDLVAASSVDLGLIDIPGTFYNYNEPTYYNVEGSGTAFLSTFEIDQYLFYLSGVTGNYTEMGQIFRVFDDTNVWLYNEPMGSVAIGDELYSAITLDTQTVEYDNYIGVKNLYDIADQLPGWYVTSVGIMVDDDVINCLTRMRYEFLQQVMCGKCPDEYLSTYAIYVGMLNAMEIQDWPTAIDFYNKLKTQCSEDMNSSCGC